MSRWDTKFTEKEIKTLQNALEQAENQLEDASTAKNLKHELRKHQEGTLYKRDKQFVDAVINRHAKYHGLDTEKIQSNHERIFNELTSQHGTWVECWMVAKLVEKSIGIAIKKSSEEQGLEAQQDAKEFVQKFRPSMVTSNIDVVKKGGQNE